MSARVFVTVLAALAVAGLTAPTASANEDEWEGLPAGEGRKEVFYLCGACHSLKLVTQQGLNRESWDESLEWMVEEQGMPPLEDEEHRLILDYLTEWYGRDQKAQSN